MSVSTQHEAIRLLDALNKIKRILDAEQLRKIGAELREIESVASNLNR